MIEEGRKVLLSTRRALVLQLLQDGAWHSTVEVCHPAIGGSEGTCRLRELREHYPIEKRKHEDHDDFEYRLLSITEVVRRRNAVQAGDAITRAMLEGDV